MKKLIFGLLALVCFLPNSFGQNNNPYNQLGKDVANAFYVITKDFQDGKIKDVDQGTLDYYFKSVLSAYPQLKLDEFNKVFNLLKASNNKSIIANSGFSDQGKTFLNKSLSDYSITKLVDEVKQSALSDKEKGDILSVLAINYNLYKPINKTTTNKGLKGPNSGGELTDHQLIAVDSNRGTTAIWGALGFITGSAICGLPCGIIGGIIGLVLGGYSNDHGGGGTTSSGGWTSTP